MYVAVACVQYYKRRNSYVTEPALSCDLHRTVHVVTLDQIWAYAVTAWIAAMNQTNSSL